MKPYRSSTVTSTLAPFLLFAQLLLSIHFSSAQVKGKITGTLIDSANAQPIPYANIILTEINENIPINGTVSQNDGSFILDNIRPDTYRLSLSFIGYYTKVLTVATGEKGEINLGIIKLKPEVNKLNEVTVTAQKNVIEQKVDR